MKCILRPPTAIDFVPTEVQRLREFPGLLPLPDLVADSVDFVDGLMHERGNLAGNHSDLTLLGPGHKLMSFCHNSNVFQ